MPFQLSEVQKKLLKDFHSTWKLKLHFLLKLPSGFWWGMRIRSISPERCEILLPYRWRTQNPFRSIYFAAQAGAAELSTGLLALLAKEGFPEISMLVTNVRMEYTKKANAHTIFVCENGEEIFKAVEKARSSELAVEVTALSTGTIPDGTLVSKAWITWSFKLRSNRA